MARVSIEDCLLHISNRFALVTIASDRARQLMGGKDSLVTSRNKESVTALREIADGLVIGVLPDHPGVTPEMTAAMNPNIGL